MFLRLIDAYPIIETDHLLVLVKNYFAFHTSKLESATSDWRYIVRGVPNFE